MLENLIKWEKEHGYKSKFVAEKLGISQAQYNNVKRGRRKPTIEMAYKFKEEFHVEDVFELLRKVN